MLKTATVSLWRLAAGNKDLCCVFCRPFCSSFPAGEIRVWDVLGWRCLFPPKYCGRHSELFLPASVLMKTYKRGYAVALIKWQQGRSWVDRCVYSLSLPQWGLAQQAKFFSPQRKHPYEFFFRVFPPTNVLNSFCSDLILQNVSVSFLSRIFT